VSRDPRHDILFEPLEIGPRVLPNRFYQVPHCMGGGSERPGLQAEFRRMKAEGGWGAVCTEYCEIHPSTEDRPRTGARLWNEDDVRSLAIMVDAVHGEGALAGVELFYGGTSSGGGETRAVPRGPSQLMSEVEPLRYPRAMDSEDIREVQGWYADAARRAIAAGFDIVYVYGAHTTVVQQFMIPLYNHRSDEYDLSSFENRARFFRETIEAVRGAIEGQAALAVRLGVDDLRGERGFQLERDALPFVEYVDELVDLWDITISAGINWGEDAGPSRFFPENSHAEWHRAVKAVTRKPMVGVGRFTSPDTMAKAILDGDLDVIGAARPSIADPFLPNKIKEGRVDEIRECIGCNVCISRWERALPIACTQNATAGEEFRRGWHPERFSRAANADSDVLVVGAGPAGMECAIVLARRGMRRVHLVEAEKELGGAMRWIPKLPALGEWARVVNYRQVQLEKLRNVEVILGERLSAREVSEYGAEIVVLATGSTWATDGVSSATMWPLPGADASQPNQLTPEQVMLEAKPVPGERVAVLDFEGYFMGVSMAERLAAEGKRVTIVTHFPEPAPMMVPTLEAGRMLQRLHSLGVESITHHVPVRIEEGGVVVADTHDAEQRERNVEVDAVVLCTARRSNDALFLELKHEFGMDALEAEGIDALYRIGDCEAPRTIADCVFDGHRLAREIDTDDPRNPLAFVRERSWTTTFPGGDVADAAAPGVVA
jgi:dimethylamine/trimethylamine dehydrogenase